MLFRSHYQRINNRFALSLAGFYDGQTGFFRNQTTGDRADKYNEAGGKLMLKSRWNRNWNVDLLANYQYVDQNGFPYGELDLETGKAALPASTFPGVYRRNNLISGINVNHISRYYKFYSTTSYQYLKDRMLMDQDYLAANYMSILQEQLQNSITQELTITSNHPVGGVWDWTAGGFFSYQWLKTNGPVYFNEAMTDPIAAAIKKQMEQAMSGRPGMAAMPPITLDVTMGAPGLYHTPQWNLGFYQIGRAHV